MNSIKLLKWAMCSALVVLTLSGCGATQPQPTSTTRPTNTPYPTYTPVPTFTFTPTPTYTPIPTHTPRPTPTPTPSPHLEGSLLDKDSGEPLVGARIVLCVKTPEQPVCVIDEELTSITDSKGRFSIIGVEPGDYGVLYNISGEAQPEWNGTELEYSPVHKGGDLAPGNVNHLLKSLGVDQASVCEAYYHIVEGNLVVSGYVYVESVDLAFVFYDGDLVYATIENDAGQIDLSVWDTINKDNCDDAERFDPWRE